MPACSVSVWGRIETAGVTTLAKVCGQRLVTVPSPLKRKRQRLRRASEVAAADGIGPPLTSNASLLCKSMGLDYFVFMWCGLRAGGRVRQKQVCEPKVPPADTLYTWQNQRSLQDFQHKTNPQSKSMRIRA